MSYEDQINDDKVPLKDEDQYFQCKDHQMERQHPVDLKTSSLISSYSYVYPLPMILTHRLIEIVLLSF